MTTARDHLQKHAALFASAKRGDLDGHVYVARVDRVTYSLPDTLKTIARELRKAARSDKPAPAFTLRDLADILSHTEGENDAQD